MAIRWLFVTKLAFIKFAKICQTVIWRQIVTELPFGCSPTFSKCDKWQFWWQIVAELPFGQLHSNSNANGIWGILYSRIVYPEMYNTTTTHKIFSGYPLPTSLSMSVITDLRRRPKQVARVRGERFRAVNELPNLSVLHHGDAVCNLIPQNLYNTDNIQFSMDTVNDQSASKPCNLYHILTWKFNFVFAFK